MAEREGKSEQNVWNPFTFGITLPHETMDAHSGLPAPVLRNLPGRGTGRNGHVFPDPLPSDAFILYGDFRPAYPATGINFPNAKRFFSQGLLWACFSYRLAAPAHRWF